MIIFTFQDYEKIKDNETDLKDFLNSAINEHISSTAYKNAVIGERYYQQDTDINRYQKFVYNVLGQKQPDLWSANHKMPSNWHFFFTVQAVLFLLGNGVSFKSQSTKDKLGKNFDQQMIKLATIAKNESCGYGFFNLDHIEIFKLTEFKALPDETTSAIRAGIRFWQIEGKKTQHIILYDEDGYTKFLKDENGNIKLEIPKTKYISKIATSRVDGNRLIGSENYSRLPIVPLWNINKRTDLEQNKSTIDGFDLIASGLVNNASRSDYIYWTLKNSGGFEDEMDLQHFIDRMRTVQAAVISEDDELQTHSVEMPYECSKATLEMLKNKLYHDYMGLKVEDVAAGNVTATQIKAAYEPLNEKTDLFETEVTTFINQILAIAGIDDEPSYVRSMIASTNEDIENVLQSAEYLGEEFTISRLCSLLGCPDDAEKIIRQKQADEINRLKLIDKMGNMNNMSGGEEE